MVAHVLRLRLALLFGALRPGRRAQSIAGFAVVVAITIVTCIAVLTLEDVPVVTARTIIVLGSAVIFLGFLIGPALVSAVDPLDPRRFGVFGADERQLPWLLALTSLVSVPSFALIAVSVCVVRVSVHHGAEVPVAVVAAVLGVVSTTLAARVGMALNAAMFPERRPRELTALFVLALVVLAFPVALFLSSLEWDGAVPDAVATLAQIAALTPFGAAPGFGIAESPWPGWGIAATTLLAIYGIWTLLVLRLLRTTDRPVASRERAGLGWFAVLPSNAFGAVAARSLVYWLRDRRYIVNMIVVPIAGVLSALPLLVAGVPMEIAALVPVAVMALFFGWLPHNDVAYDSTAFWMHVASGLRGVADRAGRLVPILLIAVPLLAVAIPLSLSIADNWAMFLPLTGLAASLFLGGLGLSSISSAISPYAVSHPGDSPFRQPQRSASRGSFGQAGAFLGAIAVSVPTIWYFALTVMEGQAHAAETFWIGIGTGCGVLLFGVLIGGLIYNHTDDSLMEFIETV